MENFTYKNPTKVIFGKGQLESLKTEIPAYGDRVLLVYGGGSIKKNGLYEKVINALKEIDAEVHELSELNRILASQQSGRVLTFVKNMGSTLSLRLEEAL